LRILSIEISAFRNIARQVVEPGPGLNVVLGSNGQGKTNLVEAIAFASWLRSFRTSRTSDLVASGGEAAHLALAVESGGARRHLEVSIAAGVRRASLDGSPVRSARDALSALVVACLSPDDPAVLEGGPDGRRALLDRFAVLLDPPRTALLSRHSRLLRERNALLRSGPEAWDEAQMDATEEALAAAGAELLAVRRAALAEVVARLPAILAPLAGGPMPVSIRYASRWAPREGTAAPAGTAAQLRAAMREVRVRDSALGYTSRGAHADDVEFELLGLAAKGHASRGQRKLVMLAWKAAEAAALAETRGEAPVLVLDDALADLDADRQEAVVAFLHAHEGQSFVTGAIVPGQAIVGATVFRASAGAFERV